MEFKTYNQDFWYIVRNGYYDIDILVKGNIENNHLPSKTRSKNAIIEHYRQQFVTRHIRWTGQS